MHNLHIGRVKAGSHEEVSNIVENRLFEWGKEDNWFTILGSFCKEDQSFSDEFDEEWFKKDEILNNPELFNDMLNPDIFEFRGLEVIEKGVQNAVDNDLLWLSKYYRQQWHLSQLSNPNKLDIWNDQYKGGFFDEYGLTDFDYEGTNTYLVFIDMHS